MLCSLLTSTVSLLDIGSIYPINKARKDQKSEKLAVSSSVVHAGQWPCPGAGRQIWHNCGQRGSSSSREEKVRTQQR